MQFTEVQIQVIRNALWDHLLDEASMDGAGELYKATVEEMLEKFEGLL